MTTDPKTRIAWNWWKPVDFVGIGLTLSLSFFIGFATVVPLLTDAQLSATGSEILASLVDEVSTIVSLYVGATLQRLNDARNKEIN